MESDFEGRIFFHLGPHKTGSTAIQQCLHLNYENLLRAGILYPRAGRQSGGMLESGHHPMGSALLQNDFETYRRIVEALRSELDGASPHSLVFSTELFSEGIWQPGLVSRLRTTFPRASISWIVYIRNQADLVESSYYEWIKGGRIRWPSGISACELPDALDHEKRLDELAAQVSGDPLIVLPYQHDVVDVFLSEIGADRQSLIKSRSRANQRLSRPAVEILRWANWLPQSARLPIVHVMHRLDRRFRRRRLLRPLLRDVYLSAAERVRISEAWKESNERVARKYLKPR